MKRIKYLLIAAFLGLMSGMALSDDTEIYFGEGFVETGVTGSVDNPSVLLLLNATSDQALQYAQDGTRYVDIVKGAVKRLFRSTAGVDVGLMANSAVIYPIRELDAVNADTIGEESDNDSISLTGEKKEYLISSSADDGMQTGWPGSSSAGRVRLGEDSLDMIESRTDLTGLYHSIDLYSEGSDGDASSDSGSVNGDIVFKPGVLTGLRFSIAPGTVLKGARIRSATLELTRKQLANPAVPDFEVNVRGHMAPDSPGFLADCSRGVPPSCISMNARRTTRASVAESIKAQQLSRREIKGLHFVVQEVIDQVNWSGRELTLLVSGSSGSGTGEEIYQSYDTAVSEWDRPVLKIRYDLPNAVADNGSGSMVALRFPDVEVPQGSRIVDAHLVFQAYEDVDASAETWYIQAERSGESKPLEETYNNISARTRTSAIAHFRPGSLVRKGEYIATTNLKEVVQEVVDESDWCGGNSALTFVIRGNGGGSSRFLSFDGYNSGGGGNTAPPKLRLTFKETGPAQSQCERSKQFKTVRYQISAGDDDITEHVARGGNGVIDRDSRMLRFDSEYQVGLRWRNIHLPAPDAIIEKVEIELFPTKKAPQCEAFIRGIYPPSGFGVKRRALSQLERKPARLTDLKSIAWSQQPRQFASADITSTFKAIIDHSQWQWGDSLSVMIRLYNNEKGCRQVMSYDNTPSKAPVLKISYSVPPTTTPGSNQGSAVSPGPGTVKKVRDRLVEIVDDLVLFKLQKPHIPLIEAARYWTGKDISDGGGSFERLGQPGGTGTIEMREGSGYLSHPATYCGPGECRAMDSDGNLTWYRQEKPEDCMQGNDSRECKTVSLGGSSFSGGISYISPFKPALFEDKCDLNNFQVVINAGLEDIAGISKADRDAISTEFVENCGDSGSDAKGCAIELAGYLYDNDLNVRMPGVQSVKTYAVNLASACPPGTSKIYREDDILACCQNADIAPDGSVCLDEYAPEYSNLFLKAIAEAGGGFYADIESEDDLTKVLDNIIVDVKRSGKAYATSAIQDNLFSRRKGKSSDQIYFGLFEPSKTQGWKGNVKRYRLCVDESIDPVSNRACTSEQVARLAVLDRNGEEARDPLSGFFKDTASSYWGNIEDGAKVTQGGSGAKFDDYSSRVILVEQGADGETPDSGTSLYSSGFKLTNNNYTHGEVEHVRDAVCSGAAEDVCDTYMQWLLGRDVKEEDPSDTRWAQGDVLHAAPVHITYGKSADGSSIGKVLVASNDGGLRMLNAATGEEDWTFMPWELLDKQRVLYDNSIGKHIYGLDSTPTLRIVDHDDDGVIEPSLGDKVQVYFGMRRGGRNYYALDLTPNKALSSASDVVEPKFLWRIKGGESLYRDLGQTWSRPVVTPISVVDVTDDKRVVRDVVIFGGGYDERFDGSDVDGHFDDPDVAHYIGSGIYIVDAETGVLLKRFSHGSGGSAYHDGRHPKMRYSIPAEVTVFDGDDDNVADRLYVGDTGGQVWRIDLGQDIYSNGSIVRIDFDRKVSPYDQTGAFGLYSFEDHYESIMLRLASISTAGEDKMSASDDTDERRFFRKLVVVEADDRKFSSQSNYLYVVGATGYESHPLNTSVQDRFYAFRDTTLKHFRYIDDVTTGSGNIEGGDIVGGGVYTVIENDDMVDVGGLSGLSSSNISHREAKGYYFSFPGVGEKSIRDVFVYSGQVFLVTYEPPTQSGSSDSSCEVDVGQAHFWKFSLLDATSNKGEEDEDSGPDPDPYFGRRSVLGEGVVSAPVPVFTSEGVKVLASAGGKRLKVLDIPDSVDEISKAIEMLYWYIED